MVQFGRRSLESKFALPNFAQTGANASGGGRRISVIPLLVDLLIVVGVGSTTMSADKLREPQTSGTL